MAVMNFVHMRINKLVNRFLMNWNVDVGSKPKTYAIGICCFFAKQAALMRKCKDIFLGIRIMCPRGATSLLVVFFNKLALWSGHHHHLIKCNLFSPWYSLKIAHLVWNNNHSCIKCNYIEGHTETGALVFSLSWHISRKITAQKKFNIKISYSLQLVLFILIATVHIFL